MIFLGPVFAFWQFTGRNNLTRKKSKQAIPLLKLPQLVLLDCIENLDVLEIIILSLLSKRAKSIAKLIRWNHLDIRLKFGECAQICLRFSTNPGVEWIIDYIKKTEYPYFRSIPVGPKVYRHLVPKDNGNSIEDIKKMIEHICEVFRSPICEIDIFDESLIEWLINFQPTIRYVSIENNLVLSIRKLDRIFNSLKVTEHFQWRSIATSLRNSKSTDCENFHITEPIPFSSISISNSYWLTLPSILDATNSVICLYDSKLTSNDINTILKQWQQGIKLRNLEFLQIETSITEDLDSFAIEVVKDLDWTESGGNDGRPMTM
ncbi:hypothetical protein B9Z55_014866 [Caenorhabditis nigoni]|uniref:F-box domain-containing protein n=1 Tax=Caenorhabditis nigoni TaxID=1611254 RepID=A0A2G5U7M9_9PELO|nr:hypothetical protein B9Z55_014866 [Caenorhabditis nigoni]